MNESKIISVIARRYGLTAICVTRMLESSKSCYRLEADNGAYVLQRFRADGAMQAKRLARLYELLADYHIAAPRVQHTRLGGLTAEVDGQLLLLRSYVPGHAAHSFNETMTWQVGYALANLHKVPAPDFVPQEHRHVDLCRRMIAASQRTGHGDKFGRQLAKRLVDARANLPTDLPDGLIHGEMFRGNVLFANGELQAIIDLETACCQPYVLDIALAIVGTCAERGTIHHLNARALVAGYQAERLLTPAERQALPACLDYATLLTTCLFYHRQQQHNVQPDASNDHLCMMRLAQKLRSLTTASYFI